MGIDIGAWTTLDILKIANGFLYGQEALRKLFWASRATCGSIRLENSLGAAAAEHRFHPIEKRITWSVDRAAVDVGPSSHAHRSLPDLAVYPRSPACFPITGSGA